MKNQNEKIEKDMANINDTLKKNDKRVENNSKEISYLKRSIPHLVSIEVRSI